MQCALAYLALVQARVDSYNPICHIIITEPDVLILKDDQLQATEGN